MRRRPTDRAVAALRQLTQPALESWLLSGHRRFASAQQEGRPSVGSWGSPLARAARCLVTRQEPNTEAMRLGATTRGFPAADDGTRVGVLGRWRWAAWALGRTADFQGPGGPGRDEGRPRTRTGLDRLRVAGWEAGAKQGELASTLPNELRAVGSLEFPTPELYNLSRKM
jgi:hypothetical protein